MKAKVNSREMKEKLTLVSFAVDSKGAIPILSGMLLDAEDGEIRVVGTDLEKGVITTVECEVEKVGKAVVNGKKITNLFSRLTTGTAELEEKGEKFYVKTATSKFGLAVMNADEYPEISLPEEYLTSIPAFQFDAGIKKISYAIGKDEARYILTGLYIKSFGNEIHFVGTDGHRLALYKLPIQAEEFEVIIPRKNLSLIRRILPKVNSEEGEVVDIALSDNKFFVRNEKDVIWSSVVELSLIHI
jgi:DNA polymerase-3 subunit beta